MKRLSVVGLKNSLGEVLNRAEYQGERLIVQRRGKDSAAIISIEELDLLDRLIREEEDRIDIAASRAAQEAGDYIPYEDFRAEMGMTNESGKPPVPDRHRRGRQTTTREAGKKGA